MKIKEIPEDFYVKELIDLKFDDKGKYSYFNLKKRDWNTLGAVREIARRLNVDEKRINFSGNKDRNAVTEQVISIFNVNKEKVENLNIKDLELKYLDNGNERINLGSHYGNFFRIVVRDVDKKIKINSKIKIKNYFDEQRFGKDNINQQIGKLILQGKFNDACEKLKLDVKDNNYIEALRRLGRRELRFYIHSYQSYLWNLVASKADNIKKIPIFGYLTEFDNKKIESLYRKILRKENIHKESFLLKQIPELSSEGGERKLYVKLKGFDIRYENDELHKDKFKAILTFTLGKGSYATNVIKALFSKSYK